MNIVYIYTILGELLTSLTGIYVFILLVQVCVILLAKIFYLMIIANPNKILAACPAVSINTLVLVSI